MIYQIMVKEQPKGLLKSQQLAGKIIDERKKIGDTIQTQLVNFEGFFSKMKTIRNGTPLKNTLEEECTETELLAICEKAQKELNKIGKR